MKLFQSAVLVSSLVVMTGCSFNLETALNPNSIIGSGVPATELRELDEYDSIRIEGAGTITVQQSAVHSVSITADDNLLEFISTEVIDGKLVISTTESISYKGKMLFEVSTKDIKEIQVDGAATTNLIDIQSSSLLLNINGAGTFKGNGTTESLDIKIKGAGSAKLAELKSNHTTLSISGAGSAKVFASDSVDTQITGAGSVEVFGNPTNRKKRVLGAGSVKYSK